eukprot:9471126-Pyramimonas_sp.AAC.1
MQALCTSSAGGEAEMNSLLSARCPSCLVSCSQALDRIILEPLLFLGPRRRLKFDLAISRGLRYEIPAFEVTGGAQGL